MDASSDAHYARQFRIVQQFQNFGIQPRNLGMTLFSDAGVYITDRRDFAC